MAGSVTVDALRRRRALSANLFNVTEVSFQQNLAV